MINGGPGGLRSHDVPGKSRWFYWAELRVHKAGAPRRYCPDLSALEAQRITFVLVAHGRSSGARIRLFRSSDGCSTP